MPSSLLARAKEYYIIEPFGAERDNIHAAIIAATVANVHISKKEKMLRPADFMIKDSATLAKEAAEKEMMKMRELMAYMQRISE